MQRFNVLIGVPSSGVISEGTAQATYQASLHHDFDRAPSCWSGANYNRCLTAALNGGLRKEYTHHAQVHADIKVYEDHLLDEDGSPIELDYLGQPKVNPCPKLSKLWLDVMLEDMEAAGVPFLSCPIALKDSRGMLSCGIGDPEDPWTIWRRFCVNELEAFPRVFTAADTGYDACPEGYGSKYLLHSFALCLFDLRHPCWYEPINERGDVMTFNLAERIVWDHHEGEFKVYCQSEDWAFCRLMWRNKVPSAITRNVKVHHLTGNIEYPNYDTPGWNYTYKHGDEELAHKWRNKTTIMRNGTVALPVS